MVQITKENGMQSAGVPFAWVEVQYPDKAQWDETGFYDMVEQHVAALREQYREYVRADVFGQNPYFRYFRKFKKTYPVMMQFESVLLKGREFPRWNAVTAVPFLVELETHPASPCTFLTNDQPVYPAGTAIARYHTPSSKAGTYRNEEAAAPIFSDRKLRNPVNDPLCPCPYLLPARRPRNSPAAR